jgi:hypothetical protein
MENKERIRKASKKLKMLLWAAFFLIPVIHGLIWIFFNHFPDDSARKMLPIAVSGDLSASTRSLGFLVGMLPAGVTMVGVHTLIRLFYLYETGRIFTPLNVRCFRNLGRTLICWVLAGVLYQPLMSIVLTMHNPPGERMVTIGLGSPDVTALLMGGVLSVIAWVMEEARILQEEQDFII